ncbi:DUF6517 family protein [Natrarchaeobius oligotrophus]|uniref:Uncharacterized protein n=1 Tax=Natrarchaeobius chitinivorans TaxID=1679083 RepID=A0A3N6MBP6_NATCH|nr:DUF6517 family protein [Natrarchaeobius chitinivorans]RQH00028.1 hypothetical protein EA472_12490 [Natrarchaeobius chitinivorans]
MTDHPDWKTIGRRETIGALAAATLGCVAGCLERASLTEYESSPAGVDSSVWEETGYEPVVVESVASEREVGVGPVTEDVTAINYLTEYGKSIDAGPLGEQRTAAFVVLSTPRVEFVGREYNPVGGMSADELVAEIERAVDPLDDVQFETERTVTVLDQSTVHSRYVGEIDRFGRSVDADLHVSEAVETDDDFVATVGVYPRRLRDGELETVRTLAEGVVPAVDADANAEFDADDESVLEEAVADDHLDD